MDLEGDGDIFAIEKTSLDTLRKIDLCAGTSQKAIEVRESGSLGQGKDKDICKLFGRLKLGRLGKEVASGKRWGNVGRCAKYNLWLNGE